LLFLKIPEATMQSELSVKQKRFQVWAWALLSAGAIYFAVARWPHPTTKDIFCGAGAIYFSLMAVVAGISIRNDWSKEQHDRAGRIVALGAALLFVALWVLNTMGHHLTSR
jgi:hypothetical protein